MTVSPALGEITFINSAPPALIKLYRKRTRDGASFPGRRILEGLLKAPNPDLERSWKNLAKHIQADKDWLTLWAEIRYIKQQTTRRLPSRKNLHNEFVEFAKAADSLLKMLNLSRKVSGTSARHIATQRLDLMAYEFLPSDVTRILGAKEWDAMDGVARADWAAKLLAEWPTFVEMLEVFRERANQLSISALTEDRPVERVRNDDTRAMCVRLLNNCFKKIFNVPAPGVAPSIFAGIITGIAIDPQHSRKSLKRSRRTK